MSPPASRWPTVELPSHARPLRLAAAIVAAGTLVWEAIDFWAAGHEDVALVGMRVLQAGLLVLVAVLSTPRRSVTALRALTLTAILSVAVPSFVVIAVLPGMTAAHVPLFAVMMIAGALFAPWSWRWQAALAAPIAAGAIVTMWLAALPTDVSPPEFQFFATTLVIVAAISIVGAHLADRERVSAAVSTARYRALFRGARDAIALLDNQGVIREGNARLEALLGWPLGELVGRTLRGFLALPARGDVPRYDAADFEAALAAEVGLASVTLAPADGQPRDVEIAFARVTTPEGPLVQAILRDLTERRALERRRVKNQRIEALARLAGGVAHQFNNLLSGILTHTSLLRGQATQDGTAAQLDEIADAVRRGRELTKELLRFTQHTVVTIRTTPPARIVESVAALARATLPTDVVVTVSLPPDLPDVAGDVDYLVHACLQLILNAREAMREMDGGTLTIGAAPETVGPGDQAWPGAEPGRYVRIAITDTGAGMDAATLERVFEPFFTTKPIEEGAGLGLAGVYRVVRAHKGTIRIDSALGRGTTVHLLIPVARAPAAEAPRAPAAGSMILVVDDEEIIRNSLRHALTEFGHRVLTAADAESALAAFYGDKERIDLLILDLVLPGGGRRVFERVRAERRDLPVLIISGYSAEGDAGKVLQHAGTSFLQKPFELAELRSAVTSALAAGAAAKQSSPAPGRRRSSRAE